MPGGGPSLDGSEWITPKHPRHRRRRKPYLTDNVLLGQAFREYYVRRLRKLLASDQLQLGGSTEFLQDKTARDAWLDELEQTDWNVFIQGPPNGTSRPGHVAKYLANYLTGGPIADGRLIEVGDDEITFWARPKRATPTQSTSKRRQRRMQPPRPYRLPARTFMQRWTLHILPKGFTKSRCYGGYHGSKRKAYLERCRELLHITAEDTLAPTEQPREEEASEVTDDATARCPACREKMELVSSLPRPSWRVIFNDTIYRTNVYSPQHHLGTNHQPGRPPP